MVFVKQNWKASRGCLVLCFVVAATHMLSNIAIANSSQEKMYSAYAEQLNALIRKADQGSTRVSRHEVERALENFIHRVESDSESLSTEDAELLLRVALDAATIVPDLVERIPEFARMIRVVGDGDGSDHDPNMPKHLTRALLLQSGLWKLINARQFDRAREFAKVNHIELPERFEDFAPPEGLARPMFLSFDGTDKETRPITQLEVMNGSWLVVEVHPDCGPSRRALSYLANHPEALSNVPESRIIFVVSQSSGQAIPSLIEWNQNNPSMRMVLSYRNEWWPKEITFIQTPVFNFVRDGEVVGKVVGWPSDKQADQLRERALGVFSD